MKTTVSRLIASSLILLSAISPIWATCGGGGGGGTGGTGGGNNGAGPASVVYNVPWKAWTAAAAPSKGLVLYWFPASTNEWNKSSLRGSRILTLYSGQCVSMTVADAREPELQKLLGDSKPPVAVLAGQDGLPLSKGENTGGKRKGEIGRATCRERG